MMSTAMMPTKASSAMMSAVMSSMMPTSKPRPSHTSMMAMMVMATHSHAESTTTMMMMSSVMMMSSTKSSRSRVKPSPHASTRTELVFSRRWISASAHSHTGVHMMTAITATEQGEAGAHVAFWLYFLRFVC
ncbi:hypothetical protein BDV32DRAFT_117336 [Aspergillus pseudonomiae]|uniref:Uncharacterized protein n=1 Tax=Aspergillus pseudonomiae TaxID=1506151 RepID=A0A5N7DJ00_9EURO|nr:uncharacterized protein BDV37DRAFT_72163 [Aspergillus pseudonomiae]KAB8264640.1 hypothetical protein BDV32DRAFT_117336 [Aspergillus pseudonomiae]KAE8405983.1 hypothetical protein BDV37DRAFT_72163 [Aspergillus pseudonomiae]